MAEPARKRPKLPAIPLVLLTDFGWLSWHRGAGEALQQRSAPIAGVNGVAGVDFVFGIGQFTSKFTIKVWVAAWHPGL
jgi:hypothetical protein